MNVFVNFHFTPVTSQIAVSGTSDAASVVPEHKWRFNQSQSHEGASSGHHAYLVQFMEMHPTVAEKCNVCLMLMSICEMQCLLTDCTELI